MTSGSVEHVPRGTLVAAAELMSLRRLASPAALLFKRQQAALGDRAALAHGQGMDYAESRQYSAGDDIRRMDWPVTARTGEPHTKVFHIEHGRETIAIADLRASMRFGTRAAFKSVVAAHVAGLAGWAAQATRGRFGAVVLGAEVGSDAPGPAERALPRACALLEHVMATESLPGHEAALDDAVSVALMRSARGATFLLASDLHDQPDQVRRSVLALATRGSVTMVWIVDPFELALPGHGRLDFLAADGVHTLDCAAPQVAREHRHYVDGRFQLLGELMRMPGVTCRLVRTGQDLFGELARPTGPTDPRNVAPVSRS